MRVDHTITTGLAAAHGWAATGCTCGRPHHQTEHGLASTEQAGAVVDEVLIGDLHLRPLCESCRHVPATVTVRWPDVEFAVCAACVALVSRSGGR